MWSRRTAQDQTPNALSVALDVRRASGASILDLTVSNPTAVDIPYPLEALRHALSQPALVHYQPHPFGLVTAREAAAQHLSARGVPATVDNVMLTASTSEAYAFLFKALTDPGDDVLVPVPSYPLLAHLAALEGVRLVPYPLAFDGTWHVDGPALRAAVTPNTRAVVVVSPNNPTGSRLTQQDLATVASLGLPILSDEVFALYPLDHAPHAVSSAAAQQQVPTAVMGGLSKDLGLPQLKLAWTCLSGPPRDVETMRARLELVADTFLSVGTPVQLGLPHLLGEARGVQQAIHQRVRANLALLRQACVDTAASVLPVDGGWSVMVRLPAMLTDEAWALRLLQEDGVLVQPGYFYDVERLTMVVLSLITPPQQWRDGVVRLLERVGVVAAGG